MSMWKENHDTSVRIHRRLRIVGGLHLVQNCGEHVLREATLGRRKIQEALDHGQRRRETLGSGGRAKVHAYIGLLLLRLTLRPWHCC